MSSLLWWFVLCCLSRCLMCVSGFFFCKLKAPYGLGISDWSSDVCSSDLRFAGDAALEHLAQLRFAGELFLCRGGCRQRSQQRSGQQEIGRASCRARVCQYVSISVVAVTVETNKMK